MKHDFAGVRVESGVPRSLATSATLASDLSRAAGFLETAARSRLATAGENDLSLSSLGQTVVWRVDSNVGDLGKGLQGG
jgi:hypothetical protein